MRIPENRPFPTVARRLRWALIALGVTLLLFEVVAQVAWRRLELRALEVRQARGEAVLRDDRIGFMKQPDPTFGYVLIPGFSHDKMKVNADGFAQPDRVPLAKRAGVMRLAALGASTTTGLNTVNANYPVHLGRLVRTHGEGYADVDVINAGVPGWVSDQVALWSARKVKHYSPDVVVLYIGWNDFQSYNPFNQPPRISYFESTYGSNRFLVSGSPLKLVSLASALFGHGMPGAWRGAEAPGRTATPGVNDRTLPYASPPEVNYRFYLASLDRIVTAFRDDNPDVRIAICTLAGRWPAGTEAQFTEDEGGAIWWMRKHGLDQEEAA